MTKTLRQKVYKRVSRIYSQFKDVPMLTKLCIAMTGIDYYQKNSKNIETEFTETDHENVALITNISSEFNSLVSQLDFDAWRLSLRENND